MVPGANDVVPGMSKIPTDKIFTIKPSEVKLSKDLPRWRKEMGDVRELAESIKTKGQIHPILLDRDNNLVCGGRRLAACIAGGLMVKAAYTDQIDPIILRELELEENLRRKGFTAGEEVLAVKELHELKIKQHGAATSGRQGGWTLEMTAALVGKTKGAIISDLQMASAVEMFPGLKGVQKKTEIAKAMKSATNLTAAIHGVAKHEAQVKASGAPYELYHGDSIPKMKGLKDGSIDILLTDPMYGIDADKTAIGVAGVTGGVTSAGFKLDDSAEPALAFINTLAVESFRFTTDKAHGYIFVGPELFNLVRGLFTAAGWLAYPKPIVWVKGESGQCNMPHAWPSSCYEACLYVRKQNSKLVKEGQPDWFQCPIVKPGDKIHPYEKPVAVWRNLLDRVAIPGQRVYDPCMGSASSVEACLDSKLFCIAGDLSLEAYSTALTRMARLLK